MIDYLYSLIAKVGITRGQDKVLHLLVGFALGLIGAISLDGLYVLLPVIIFAVGKEVRDYLDYGKFDFYDMFLTLVGGWLGVMIVGLL